MPYTEEELRQRAAARRERAAQQRQAAAAAAQSVIQPDQTVTSPLNVEQPEQKKSGGGFFGGAADLFRDVVPKGVRDAGGAAINTTVSGERFLDTVLPGNPGTALGKQIDRVPVVGGVARAGFDTLTSPITLLTAGAGGAIANSGVRGAGMLAPLVEGRFATRLGAEMAAGMAAEGAAEFADRAGAPMPVQLGVGLVGGLAGVRSFRGTKNAIEAGGFGRITEEVLQKEITSGDPVRKLVAIIKTTPAEYGAQAELRSAEMSARTGQAYGMIRDSDTLDDVRKIVRGAQKGALPSRTLGDISARFEPEEIVTLKSMIRDHPVMQAHPMEMANAADAFDKLMLGPAAAEKGVRAGLPTPYETKLLETVFGPQITEVIQAKRTMSKKAWDTFLDIAGIPRSMMASFDLSFPLRQGVMMASRKEWRQSWKPMMQALLDPKYANDVDISIRSDKWSATRKKFKVYHAPMEDAAALSQRDEQFMSKLIDKVPVVGPTKKATERAYLVAGNKMRADVFNNIAEKWARAGKTPTDADYKSLAAMVNTLTGRGNLPVNTLVAAMSQVFFSPRLLVSTAELMSGYRYLRSTPLVRRELARDLVAFYGTGLLGLSLLKAGQEFLDSPVSVEFDPRSSKVGQIVIGNTHIDPWRGHTQMLRYMTQLISNESKASTGDIKELNRMVTLGRFTQSKLAPAPGLLVDLLRGESFIGDEVDVKTASGISEQAAQRLVPFFAQDIYDAMKDQGLIGAALVVPFLGGFGTNTYSSVASIREAGAQEIYKKTWSDLTGDEKDNVELAYAEEFAKQREPKEGSYANFIAKQREQVLASEQQLNARRAQGMDAREFNRAMTDLHRERMAASQALADHVGMNNERTPGVVGGALDAVFGGPPSKANDNLLDRFFALRDQAMVGGVVDYELLDELEGNFISLLTPRERQVISERSQFQHDPSVQWYYDAKEYVQNSGYYGAVTEAMDQFRPALERMLPGIRTYRELVVLSRTGQTPRERVLADGMLRSVDKLVDMKRRLMRLKDAELNTALTDLYGVAAQRSSIKFGRGLTQSFA